jgi:hypothetical protein
MHRAWIISWALLVCVTWQTMAVAYFSPLTTAHADADHAVMHLEKQAHHHGDDGAIELDESVESLLHLMVDAANANGLRSQATLQLLAMDSVSPLGCPLAGGPSSCLEAFLRPPRPAV